MSRSPAVCLLAVLPAAIVGCDPPSDETAGPSSPSTMAAEVVVTSPWTVRGGAALIAIDEEAGLDDVLAAATAEARRTAGDAQARWNAGDPETRTGWAVKWAAQTVDGGMEHVWVEPARWSRFRVEGRLASQPLHDLACGRARDELVGFAAEELVDWARFSGPNYAEVAEGGFTIQVLEGHFGSADPGG